MMKITHFHIMMDMEHMVSMKTTLRCMLDDDVDWSKLVNI